ncbi:hypothetical protein EW146_g9513, partial [Bondarzewia mesenterica]
QTSTARSRRRKNGKNSEGEKYEEKTKGDGELPTVDVLSWLGRATLDVIGEAGFGYRFDALTDTTNELASAFGIIFSTARKFRVMTILQVWFPLLRRFRRNNQTMRDAHATMRRIGMQLVQERRALVEAELASLSSASTDSHDGNDRGNEAERIEGDRTVLGRDILSVLIRSNVSSTPSQQLSLPEVLSQISTFLAAGHETTASALTWTLYALARAPGEQRRVRRALRALGRAEGAELMAAIERESVLDRAVKEALRLHAPVGSTMRTYVGKQAEVVVPVSRGVRVRAEGRSWLSWRAWVPFWKGEGGGGTAWTVERGVRLRRGDIITIPIQAVNRCPEIWGEDAKEFRPDRWLDPPATASAVQGLYAHTLTFLNGTPVDGNRACIGYRFALTEIKIFLYVLLRDIEFTMDEDVVIEKRVNVVTRPFVKSAPGSGNQMPLRIRRVLEDEE